MRFAALPPSQPDRPSAAELIQHIFPGKAKPVEAQPDAKKATTELPLDLDQRVRLVGEW